MSFYTSSEERYREGEKEGERVIQMKQNKTSNYSQYLYNDISLRNISKDIMD